MQVLQQIIFQVHEVKEHIKVHNSISEVEDLKKELKSLKTQVGELEVKLKNSQSKLASQNGQENEFKKKSKLEDKKEILVPGIDQDKVKENTAATTIYLLVIILLQKRSLLNVQFVQKSFPTEVTCQFTFQLFMKVKKTFECDTCGNRFKEKSKLKIHISSVHERNRLFECEI
jgi:hypothetical protein